MLTISKVVRPVQGLLVGLRLSDSLLVESVILAKHTTPAPMTFVGNAVSLSLHLVLSIYVLSSVTLQAFQVLEPLYREKTLLITLMGPEPILTWVLIVMSVLCVYVMINMVNDPESSSRQSVIVNTMFLQTGQFLDLLRRCG